jgi:hypothetical protein
MSMCALRNSSLLVHNARGAAIVHWTRLTGTQCAAAALLCDGDDMSSSLYTLWSGVVVGTPKYIINNIIQQQKKTSF